MKRTINEKEYILLEWLIKHSEKKMTFDISPKMIVFECKCGCSSYDFIDKSLKSISSMEIVSDWLWETPEGYFYGVYLYLVDRKLGGVDLYSVDGKQEIHHLPNTADLYQK